VDNQEQWVGASARRLPHEAESPVAVFGHRRYAFEWASLFGDDRICDLLIRSQSAERRREREEAAPTGHRNAFGIHDRPPP
jgi:hypothetical protein